MSTSSNKQQKKGKDWIGNPRKRKRDGEGSERATNVCRREVRERNVCKVRKVVCVCVYVCVCVLKNRA